MFKKDKDIEEFFHVLRQLSGIERLHNYSPAPLLAPLKSSLPPNPESIVEQCYFRNGLNHQEGGY